MSIARGALRVPREVGDDGPVVLNTRPREQAAELSQLLRQAGYTPVEVPAIETVPAWRADELTAVLQKLRDGQYAWGVFASRNAVRFFLEGLAAVGGNANDLRSLKLLSGTGTADELRAHRLQATRTLARFSAAAALTVLQHEPGVVLVPRAATGRDELISRLPHVDAPVCYRTQPVPPTSLPDSAAAIFTSPSAVQALVGHLPAGAAIVCLGSTTAEAARAAGLRVSAVAERTDLRSLVEAVAAALEVAA
jgi:uroporphyrinogen-III synthase